MRRAIPILFILLTGCSTPFLMHAHFEGSGKADGHFDGGVFAAKAEGGVTAAVGITDKGGLPVYPPTGLLVLGADGAAWSYGIDLNRDDDPNTPEDERVIGYEAAMALLGGKHD